MFKPLVTIAIPTFNRADTFLPGCITSALSQTYKPLEILVSDNCSSDGTQNLVSQIVDERITYIRHSSNLGANGNFNACLDAARGQYFLLLHDDDRIDPDFVETCIRAASYRTDIGFIRSGTRVIDDNGQVLWQRSNKLEDTTVEGLGEAWFRRKTTIYLCSTIFNTTALRHIGGLHSRHNLLEDCYSIVKLCEKYPQINIERVMASFRSYADQRTYSVPIREWCEDFRGLLDLMVLRVNKENQISFSRMGLDFFAGLCEIRANTIASPTRRILAHITIVRYFGIQRKIRQLVMPVLRKIMVWRYGGTKSAKTDAHKNK